MSSFPIRFLIAILGLVSTFLQKTNRPGCVVVENCRGKRAAQYGCGVDVHPVRSQVRLSTPQRGMTVNDEAAVVARIGQKRLPHPQQVVPVLLIEWSGRIDAGMNEKSSAVIVMRR